MKLVNLEGSAFVGVGSEWFWSMAQFIVVLVTLFGIYRQLRAQGAANALARIETLHRRYESRQLALARLTIAIELREGRSPAQMTSRVDLVAGFFETLYELQQAGFMSVREIDNRFGGSTELWWRLTKLAIEGSRRAESDANIAIGFEHLNEICNRIARDRGTPRTWVTDSPLRALLDEVIVRATESLELMNETDSGTIPHLSMPRPAEDGTATVQAGSST